MAAPMLFMTSDQISSQETKPEKTRGRKTIKGANPKKQPQRGLGVAQLERLRLQERWKRMTELPHSQHLLMAAVPSHGSVPVEYAAPNYCGATATVNDFSGGAPGFPVPMNGNGSFTGDPSGLMVFDPYGDGCTLETSRELSSMPKMVPQCVSDCCDICFKKKRFTTMNSCDFLGLNIESHSTADYYTGCVVYKGAEVKKIHRKVGNTAQGGGSLLMEYEFFPGKGGRGGNFKEVVLPTEGEGSEASYNNITTGCSASTATACNIITATPDALDLSLKLSL